MCFLLAFCQRLAEIYGTMETKPVSTPFCQEKVCENTPARPQHDVQYALPSTQPAPCPANETDDAERIQ